MLKNRSKEPEISFWTCFTRVIRTSVLICVSITGVIIAFLGACNGEWTKAIFGLVLMMAADCDIDKINATYEKKDKELLQDLEEAEFYRQKTEEILSQDPV